MLIATRRTAGMPATVLLLCILVWTGEPVAAICGDADRSGTTTVTDGVQILRAAADLSTGCTGRECDMNGDGSVTVSDGVVALRVAADLSVAASCATRFGELVKTVRTNGVRAELHLEPPPAAAPGARVDVLSIEGSGELASGQPTTLTVGLDSPVDSVILGLQENGASVDGFVEVPTGSAATVELEVEAADVSASTGADLSVGTRAGDQVGGARTKPVTFIPSGIGCDHVIDDQLEANLDTDRFPLSVIENQRLEVDLEAVAPANGFDPVWRLLDRDGATHCQFCTGALCGRVFHGTGLSHCENLPTAGNPYRIEVTDAGSDATGTYRLHLQHLDFASSCESAVAQNDTVTHGGIDQTLDTDLLTLGFSPTDGEIITINVAASAPGDPNFNVVWRMLNGAGDDVCVFCVGALCGRVFHTGLADCGPLSAADAPYRIEVLDGGSDASGGYDIFIQH
jgi:hypothetical protein